jgi:hypothetical protein
MFIFLQLGGGGWGWGGGVLKCGLGLEWGRSEKGRGDEGWGMRAGG